MLDPSTIDRPSLDDMLLGVASVVAERSTCSRRKVGAVLARGGRILSTGYNGAPTGAAHCKHTEDRPCYDSVHAEANAIVFAARHGSPVEGASMYTTDSPCAACAGLIVNAGVVEVVYARAFRKSDGIERLAAAGLTVRKYP